MTEQSRGSNGKRSVGARVASGLLVIFLALLIASLFGTHVLKPILVFWEPAFTLFFGEIRGEWGNVVPKFLGFLLFSGIATVVSAIIIDAIITSRYFGFLARLLYKVPIVKEVLSFFQKSTNLYRNLRQARPVAVKIGDIKIPAFVTKERVLIVDGREILHLVIFCPHTPTFFSGNTIYIQKEEAGTGIVIDVPRGGLIEDVLSAGIFGVRDEPRAQKTTGE